MLVEPPRGVVATVPARGARRSELRRRGGARADHRLGNDQAELPNSSLGLWPHTAAPATSTAPFCLPPLRNGALAWCRPPVTFCRIRRRPSATRERSRVSTR